MTDFLNLLFLSTSRLSDCSMAKLIQFNPDTSRRRALKKAGARREEGSETGQLNLFSAPQSDSPVHTIHTFANPFAKALYLDQRDEKGAEKAYLEAIERDVRPADSWCNLAIIYAHRHEDVRALDALSRALSLEPRHAVSHYNMANLYLDRGDLNLAQLHYELAKEIDPDLAEAYFNLGLVYLIKGQRKMAIEMLQKYEEYMPGGLAEIEEFLKGTGH